MAALAAAALLLHKLAPTYQFLCSQEGATTPSALRTRQPYHSVKVIADLCLDYEKATPSVTKPQPRMNVVYYTNQDDTSCQEPIFKDVRKKPG